jgi:anti-sigma-K factor RskA
METNEILDSGLLEAYVCGFLNQEESVQVAEYLKKHPELLVEIEKIESTLGILASSSAPLRDRAIYDKLVDRLDLDNKIRQLEKPRRTQYLAWAASVIAIIGLSYAYLQNQTLNSEIQEINIANENLRDSLNYAFEEIESSKEINSILAGNSMISELAGQTVSPNSAARVIVNSDKAKVIVDASGLPVPPPGKVYQVWSLTFDPLTPSSMGLLENFTASENRLFVLQNQSNSEGYGITLEPAGGSETPTLEQLYVLGKA